MKAELQKFAQIHKPCVGCVDENNRLDVYNYMMFAFLVTRLSRKNQGCNPDLLYFGVIKHFL